MRLGVNAVRLTRRFTGVGRYLENLLREWSAMALPFAEVVLYSPVPLEAARFGFPLDRYRVELLGRPLPDPLWEWWFLGPRARADDLLFSPSYTLPLHFRGRGAVAYFGPATNRRGGYEWLRAAAYDRLHRASARRAVHVFTAADVVRRRVVAEYGVPEERVEVIPLAAAPHFAPVTDRERLERVRRQLLGTEAPYVLFVGKISGRHHLPRLVEAFARARAEAALPHRLVLVGPNTLRLDLAALSRAHGLDPGLIHVPWAPDADLPALYSGAEVFAFPGTEAEGFGLPIVEAMACGAPVLATALGSVPEVAGEAALLVPSSTAEALAEALLRLLRDPGLRRDLARRGLERAARLSWRTTAERTMDALWRVAKPRMGA